MHKIDKSSAGIDEEIRNTTAEIKKMEKEILDKQNDKTLVEVYNKIIDKPVRYIFDLKQLGNSYLNLAADWFQQLTGLEAKIPWFHTEFFEYDGSDGPFVDTPEINYRGSWDVVNNGKNGVHYKATYQSSLGCRADAKLILRGYRMNLQETKRQVRSLINKISDQKQKLSTLRKRLEDNTESKHRFLNIIEKWQRTLVELKRTVSLSEEKERHLDNDMHSQLERAKEHKVSLESEMHLLESTLTELKSFKNVATDEQKVFEQRGRESGRRYDMHKQSVLGQRGIYELVRKFAKAFSFDRDSLIKFNRACDLAKSFGIRFSGSATPFWREESSSREQTAEKFSRNGDFSKDDMNTAKKDSIADITLEEYASRTVEEEVREEHEQPVIERSLAC